MLGSWALDRSETSRKAYMQPSSLRIVGPYMKERQGFHSGTVEGFLQRPGPSDLPEILRRHYSTYMKAWAVRDPRSRVFDDMAVSNNHGPNIDPK